MASSTFKCPASVLFTLLLFFTNRGSAKLVNGSCPLAAGTESACLPVGESFNLFHNYGFLALSIQVAPLILFPAHLNGSLSKNVMGSRGNSSTTATVLPSLFHMVTHPILDRKLYKAEIKRIQVNNPRNQPHVMERLVRLHLCDGLDELMARFMTGFTVDGLHKPWRAFTASWKKHILPKIFGLPVTYLTDDFTFLLIRIEKRSVSGSINGSIQLEPDLTAKIPSPPERADHIHSLSLRTAIDFFVQFGTHLVSNYTAGDALFQIIVFNGSSSAPSTSAAAKHMIDFRQRVDEFNPANATRLAWMELLIGRTPYVHIGKLQLISGNRTQIVWLESRLAVSTLPKTLPSSVRLLAAPVLFNLFYRQMQPRAVLSLNLMSVARAVPDWMPDRRQWLNTTLANLLHMWEYNM